MHSKIISISAVIIIFINTLIFFKVENFKNKNTNILIKKENKHSIGLLKKKEMQTDLIIKYEPLLPLTAEEQAEYKENKKLDINQAQLEDLISLPAISEKTAENIIDYRIKNGKFKRLDDLLNVTGIGKSKFEQIKNLVRISDANTTHSDKNNATKKKVIDLNTADFLEFIDFGFKPEFAQQIIDYREENNGFKNINDLYNLRGIGDKKFSKLKERCIISAYKPKKIKPLKDLKTIKKQNLNNLNYIELRRCDYITPKIAKAIINYRAKTGGLKKITDLLKIKEIDQQTYNRLEKLFFVE